MVSVATGFHISGPCTDVRPRLGQGYLSFIEEESGPPARGGGDRESAWCPDCIGSQEDHFQERESVAFEDPEIHSPGQPESLRESLCTHIPSEKTTPLGPVRRYTYTIGNRAL